MTEFIRKQYKENAPKNIRILLMGRVFELFFRIPIIFADMLLLDFIFCSVKVRQK